MRITFVILNFVVLTNAVAVYAWSGSEHIEIGEEAYYRACRRAELETATLDDTARDRLRIACMPAAERLSDKGELRVSYTYQLLMGEWSALAADHTERPEQLTSVQLGDVAVDYRLLGRIATTNYRHFHPASVTSWRTEHLTSLDTAAAAAAVTGIHLVERYEAAMAIQAFAQHYLQDSFAAGHMGFNRVASSNAGALTYHNTASRTGRCVSNIKNEAWYTYGDHYLGRSPEGAERVMDAAAESAYDFIITFVRGATDQARWQIVWGKLPAYYNEHITIPGACRPGYDWPALRSVSTPAQAVFTYELFSMRDASIYGAEPVGIMIGASRDLGGPFRLGYRSIRGRVYAALGTTVAQNGTRPRAWLLDFGEVFQVATTHRGMLTHEIGFGELIYYRPHNDYWYSYRTASVRLLYALNVEAGRVYWRIQTGFAHGDKWGANISAGFGWVRASAK